MILKCTCYHPVQDSLYGVGRRVHNKMTRTTSGQKYRCTVCKTERESSLAGFPLTPVEKANSGETK